MSSVGHGRQKDNVTVRESYIQYLYDSVVWKVSKEYPERFKGFNLLIRQRRKLILWVFFVYTALHVVRTHVLRTEMKVPRPTEYVESE